MTSSLSLKYVQQISGAGLPSIYFYEGVISMSTEAIYFQSTGLPTAPGMWRSGMNEYENGCLAEGNRHTGWPGTNTSWSERKMTQETRWYLSLELISNPMDSYLNLGGERALNKNEKSCFRVTHIKEETCSFTGWVFFKQNQGAQASSPSH